MATVNSESQNPDLKDVLRWTWGGIRSRWRRNRVRQLNRVRFRLTREGVHFIGILAFIFIGAVIRDINLLILLAGTMIGLLMLQWRFNTSTLVGLDVKRSLPSNSTAEKPADIPFSVINPKRWLSAWLVMIEDPVSKLASRGKRLSARGMGIVDAVRPRGSADDAYRLVFHQRGKYQIGPSTISTRFPLGLGRGWRTLDNAAEMLVHPRQGELTRGVEKLFHLEMLGQTKASAQAGAHEGEFFGLRSWANGDSKRWIHWRTTARLGELSVRQFEQNQKRQICILLDLYDSGTGADDEDVVEQAVSFLATLASKTVRQQRDKLTVAIASDQALAFSAVQSPVLVNNLLDELATVQPSKNPDLRAALLSLNTALLRNNNLIVISTRASQFDSLDTGGDPVVSKLLGRVRTRWLNVAENDLEPYFQWT